MNSRTYSELKKKPLGNGTRNPADENQQPASTTLCNTLGRTLACTLRSTEINLKDNVTTLATLPDILATGPVHKRRERHEPREEPPQPRDAREPHEAREAHS